MIFHKIKHIGQYTAGSIVFNEIKVP